MFVENKYLEAFCIFFWVVVIVGVFYSFYASSEAHDKIEEKQDACVLEGGKVRDLSNGQVCFKGDQIIERWKY